MQSQGGGGGGPESRYAAMSYAAHSDGVDLYGHGPADAYTVLSQHQHHMHGPPGLSPTGHHHSLGLGSPPGHHHQHGGKRSAESAGLNLKQDPMVGDVNMSSIGMGHNTMDDGPGGVSGVGGGQNGGSQPGATKKTPPPNGKKTKGRVKIKMEFIDNKLRRYTTFSKRKTGIMKKAYELSTLTGTQVMLLVASETGHVYTFATRKLQPMITSEAGKALIQTCLNSPDPPSSSVDQRMSATGFEETELTYTLHDEDQKDSDSDDGGEGDEAGGSSDAAGASRSPSPVEQSYSSDEDPPPQPPVTRASNKGSGRNSTGSETLNGSGSRTNNSLMPSTGNLPVNLSTTQLANISGLSGLSLPRGANLASLLASASGLSSLLAGAAAAAAAGGSTGSLPASSSADSSSSRKNLPRLISLAHLGTSLQPSNNISAKDATAAPSGCSTVSQQQHQRGLSSNNDARRDSSALNLQTSSNMRDKKGNAKSRPAGGGKKAKK